MADAETENPAANLDRSHRELRWCLTLIINPVSVTSNIINLRSSLVHIRIRSTRGITRLLHDREWIYLVSRENAHELRHSISHSKVLSR